MELYLSAAAAYFQHVCIPTAHLFCQAGLRSVKRGDLAMPRTAKELSKRSFSVAALVILNSLLQHLHSFSVSEVKFQRGLETHVFLRAYSSSVL